MGAAAADLGWPRGLRSHGEFSSEVPEVGEVLGGPEPDLGGTQGGGTWGARAARARERLRGGDSGRGFPQPGGGPSRGPGAV